VRGRRRRRGGRGRRRDHRAGDEPRAEGAPDPAKELSTEPHEADHGAVVPGGDEHDGAEEPDIGSLSAEARAAALAETGVLEGDIEEDESETDANATRGEDARQAGNIRVSVRG
jgi:hypothetical protein